MNKAQEKGLSGDSFEFEIDPGGVENLEGSAADRSFFDIQGQFCNDRDSKRHVESEEGEVGE